MTIVGVSRHLEGISKKTSKPYSFYNVNTVSSYPTTEHGIGKYVEAIYVPSVVMEDMLRDYQLDLAKLIGKEIRPNYNRSGFLISFDLSK